MHELDLLAYEGHVVENHLHVPVGHWRAINRAALARTSHQPLHTLIVAPDVKISARKECDERIIIVVVFPDFVILETAAKRRQQQNRTFNRLVRHRLDDSRKHEAVEGIVADLNRSYSLIQISPYDGVLRADDLVRLRLSDTR